MNLASPILPLAILASPKTLLPKSEALYRKFPGQIPKESPREMETKGETVSNFGEAAIFLTASAEEISAFAEVGR
jgi:hypothetical protein